MKKKYILFLLVVLGGVATTHAQAPKAGSETRKVAFGIKVGTNFSWFKADSKNLDKGGFKPGLAYGIMGDFNFQENYAFSFEFLVSNLNGTMTYKNPMDYKNLTTDTIQTASNIKYSYTNKYVQIPISLKFRTREIGLIKYYAQFGLAPAIRVSSKAKISADNMPWSDDDLKNIKTNDDTYNEFEPVNPSLRDDVSFLNLPLIIGGGIEYNLSGNTSLYINVRYENGFTNILKSTATKVFSKNVALSLGVFF